MNSGGNGNHSDVLYFHILSGGKLLDRKILLPSINSAGNTGISASLLQTFTFYISCLFLCSISCQDFPVPPSSPYLCCFPFLYSVASLSLLQFSFVCFPTFSFNYLSHNLVPSSFVCPLICQKQKCFISVDIQFVVKRKILFPLY